MVKLIIQEILVLINNYFSFFTFGQIMVKLWSNYGQTMVKLIIQEILVLFFRKIVSNSNSEMCDFMLKLNSWG